MRSVLKWVQKLQETSGEKASVQSVCFHPEGNHVIAAAGNNILVYEPLNGSPIKTLKAHKDCVYCVAYSRDGKKFASGGADKIVVIWSNKFEGLLKYSHNDTIQCLSFNPVFGQLASCSLVDFALWSGEQKAVQKFKIISKINTCSWTNDGQYLILGLANGTISIRNKVGEETSKINRVGGTSSSISGIQCNPIMHSDLSSIAVIDWRQTLSFYSLSGEMLGKERCLGFDPLCLTYFSHGELIIVAGCSKSVHLFTKDGVKLGLSGEIFNSWILSVAVHPSTDSYVVGCQDGLLACYNIVFSTVHALYRERYAFRENMCDVIIQHLISGQKVRIKCRDLIHKIAIYKSRLAVQLPERVVLYELSSNDNQPMHYKVKEKIIKRIDCSLMVVCSQNIILCQNKTLQSIDYKGVVQKEWILNSSIRYIKVIGGPMGKEGLFVGLTSGQVWRIFLDNISPFLITTVMSSVRCLDLNSTRNKIAIVDDVGRLVVRDILNNTILYQDSGVNSVAWNTHLDGMLCYSHTTGGLSVRVGNLPSKGLQNVAGIIVGLCGASAFCLRGNVMHNISLSLGTTMWQFIEAGYFEEAYEVACICATNSDWESLAHAALESLQFNVAKNAFVKTRNLLWLQLIHELSGKQKHENVSKEMLLGEIYSFAGKFKDAARLFQKCGENTRIVHMYTDLRMFDLAQEYLKEDNIIDKHELILKRAEWAYSIHEPRTAFELLLSIGENERAVQIAAAQEWSDVLYDVGRRLYQNDTQLLRKIAFHLKRLKALPLAAEIFKTLGEESQLIQLHIEARDWVEAFKVVEHNSNFSATVHFQHAVWLEESDQFIAAYKAYIKSGKINDARKLLRNLYASAVMEKRFLNASYFHWIMASQVLNDCNSSSVSSNEFDTNMYLWKEYELLLWTAKIYYAYSTINYHFVEPFTSSSSMTLFNTSRYIANEINNRKPPKGVSLFTTFYTLSKQAKLLNANKLHFKINKKIQSFKPPSEVQDLVDLTYLNSKARKTCFNDFEELLPLCYKCSNYSSHINDNKCSTCQQEFIFSFVSFEILPLVKFQSEIDIDDNETERILLAPPKAEEKCYDPFTENIKEAINKPALTLDRNSLKAVDPNNVLIIKHKTPLLKNTYYECLLSDLQITFCPECLLIFYAEDFELQMLQKGYCPFCRTSSKKLQHYD